MVNYSSLYPGATYLLEPSYNFLGYRIPIGDIGGTTSIQTANQLKEVSKLLNQGMKVTEVSVIQPEVFEMMPKDHLKEINRLNKLIGAESTLHAPIIEPSGVDPQQGGWSEDKRVMAENQLKEIIARSHELSPKGNLPVTIHASNLPGSELIPEIEKGKGPEYGRIIAIDRESGKPANLEREETFWPGEVKFEPGKKAKGRVFTPEERLEAINNTQWRKTITDLDFYKKEADDIILKVEPNLFPYFEKIKEGRDLTREERETYGPSIQQIERAGRFIQNVRLNFQNIFEKAAKFSDLDSPVNPDNPKSPKTREVLQGISEEWRKLQNKAISIQKKGEDEFRKYHPLYIKEQSNLLDMSMKTLNMLEAPKQFIKIEDFAKDKSSETLANVALHAYKKFGDTSPIVSIENPPYGMAVASGKELKNLIDETRKKFVSKLVNEGKSKAEAQKAAERLIGATWDTSHISMMRKQGFGPEQITAETKEIAKYVKHLHYNDNFGSTHTDLPPGMGSLPMKDILKELEKGGFKGKRIFEGGNFFQHFQTSPFPYTLETGGSPIYETGVGPSWNQVWGYFAPYYADGPTNPMIHHQTYGAGFQTLPLELGGEMPGGRDRLSGAPMQ